MGFASSIKANSNKILLSVDKQCCQIACELFALTVRLTPSPSFPGPYAIGKLANQWYPEVGSYFSEELSSDISATGADSLARISALLTSRQFYKNDGVMTLTNNLSYAYRAEVLGWPANEGWSGTIGPYRMVWHSIKTISAKYK